MNTIFDNNKNDENELSFSNRIKFLAFYFLKKICIYILIFIIIYIIEKLIYSIILLFLFFPFLAIIFQIILHLLLLRYLILKVAFAGLSFFISRNIQYNRGKLEASYIYKELIILKSSLDLFLDEFKPVEELKNFYTLHKNIKNSVLIINHFWKIFNKMKERFNELTYDQNIFYENINNLKKLLEKSEILNFLNYIIIKMREEKIININNISKKEKDKITERKNTIKNNIKINANNIINFLINQLIDYIGENYKFYSPRYIRNYFSNLLFASLNQFDVELDSYYIFEKKNLVTKDRKANIEYIIINNNTGIKQKIKKLMIICGPNAEPYQIFARSFPLSLYLNKGIDVLCWNYRGYGFSTGKATFDNLREDIIEIYEEIKKNNSYEKIGVHGISLGGIPACHLAGNVEDIKLLVSDRNFGQIEYIVKNCYLGKYLVFIYNILFMQNSNNVDNYLNGNGIKIILNDPNDEIVTEEGALKTMISDKLCKEYLEIIEDNHMIELNNLENDDTLENTNITIDNSSDSNQIEIEGDDNNDINYNNNKSKKSISLNIHNKSNYDLINQSNKNQEIIYINKFKKRNDSTMLDILLSSEKNNFLENVINISKFLISEKESENIQSNISEYIHNKIAEILQNFRGAGDTLYRITKINNNNYNQNLFLENFFNNLFVWGTYDKLDDYDCIYNSTEFIDKMIEKVINITNKFLNSEEINNNKNLDIINYINIFNDYLIIIRKKIKSLAIKTSKGFIYLNEGEKYENEFIKLGRGNLVSLSCGHNGRLSEEETMVFKYYLNKSELFKVNKDNKDIYNNNEIDNSEYINNENEDLDASFSALTKEIEDD